MAAALPSCRCLVPELEQDVLVITPEGDAAGFSPTQLGNDVTQLTEYLRENESIRHVVVDLGNARYFGSQVIGGFVKLGEVVTSRGGRCILVNASEDMRGVFSVFRLGDRFEEAETKTEALKRVVARPGVYRNRTIVKVVAGLLLLAAVGALIVLFVPGANVFATEPDRFGEAHAKLSVLWESYKKDREQLDQPDERELKRFISRYRVRVSAPLQLLTQHISLLAVADEAGQIKKQRLAELEAARALNASVQSNLRPMIREPLTEYPARKAAFEQSMSEAAKYLEQR